MKTEEENEALQFCYASAESAHTAVEAAKLKVADQIARGWWHPRDLMKKGMRLNVLDPDAPTPWVMCSIVLTGTPDGKGTTAEREENPDARRVSGDGGKGVNLRSHMPC